MMGEENKHRLSRRFAPHNDTKANLQDFSVQNNKLKIVKDKRIDIPNLCLYGVGILRQDEAESEPARNNTY
jgi:hypothetical protein